MLTAQENALLTQTGPGTPGGDFMRRYWQPAALSQELGADPLYVKLLSEEFVLFRDAQGAPCMLDLHCAHRKADLSYGRMENGTLRCLYHGWRFGGDGTCLEQPGEGADSTFRARVRQPAYPARDLNGIIFVYLGPGEPPAVPDIPWLTLPRENSWTTKLLHECNYLQGNEGNVDPQHLSFLHRTFELGADTRASYVFTARDAAPQIDVEETPYGLRIFAIRDTGEGEKYVRVSNFIMPNGSAFPAGQVVDPERERIDENTHYSMHFHIPIDDVNHWKYRIMFRLDGPVDTAFLDREQNDFVAAESFERKRGAHNRYLQDRDEQHTQTFTGMGRVFQDHDRFAVESQGRILDRTTEHLATTDKAVIAMRRQMLAGIETVRTGGRPPMTDPNVPNPCRDLVVRSARVPAGENPHDVWRTRVAP
ncbi:MAG TPA: aromatic ring-hydroxylating dioxygenase subunit alpha [Candidatus Lustribacter sp.]|jgi:phenylpropionate dioxygenase-like ring-hydroxylating dioxygenase large terminal subunit|nr:aromatic ring-hydroxylating dioxygenase subunit alpha [Candidatus Lustribacter sp.]